jgi:hypothetical protein
MKYRILGTVAAVALMASTSANALVIDDFTVTQILAATASGTVAAGIGGEREASITQNTGTSSVLDINNSSAGELLFANAGGQATVVVLYDGVGSGGFTATDLTVGGTQNAFEFIVTNSDFANDMTISVTSGANTSTLLQQSPTLAGPATPFVFDFANFTGTADFTVIDSIQITLINNQNDNADISFSLLGTTFTGEVVVTVPEPGSLAILGIGLIGLAGFYRRRNKTA